MATRGRRRTNWEGSIDQIELTESDSSDVATAFTNTTVENGATILRIVGTVEITAERSTTGDATPVSEGARIRWGIMVQNTGNPEILDLSTAGVLADERWMVTGARTLVAQAYPAPYWNGSAAINTYPKVITAPYPISIDLDVRAKRKFHDPAALCCHATWATGEGTDLGTVRVRFILRTLMALP